MCSLHPGVHVLGEEARNGKDEGHDHYDAWQEQIGLVLAAGPWPTHVIQVRFDVGADVPGDVLRTEELIRQSSE